MGGRTVSQNAELRDFRAPAFGPRDIALPRRKSAVRIFETGGTIYAKDAHGRHVDSDTEFANVLEAALAAVPQRGAIALAPPESTAYYQPTETITVPTGKCCILYGPGTIQPVCIRPTNALSGAVVLDYAADAGIYLEMRNLKWDGRDCTDAPIIQVNKTASELFIQDVELVKVNVEDYGDGPWGKFSGGLLYNMDWDIKGARIGFRFVGNHMNSTRIRHLFDDSANLVENLLFASNIIRAAKLEEFEFYNTKKFTFDSNLVETANDYIIRLRGAGNGAVGVIQYHIGNNNFIGIDGTETNIIGVDAGTDNYPGHIVSNSFFNITAPAVLISARPPPKVRHNEGFNPYGLIATAFENAVHEFGLPAGGAAGPTVANQDYTCIGVDCILDITGGTGVTVTLKDPAGNTISTFGAPPVHARYIPIDFILNFGNFTVAPTVIVSGN